MIASQSVSIWGKGIKDEKKLLYFIAIRALQSVAMARSAKSITPDTQPDNAFFRLQGLKFHLSHRHFL